MESKPRKKSSLWSWFFRKKKSFLNINEDIITNQTHRNKINNQLNINDNINNNNIKMNSNITFLNYEEAIESDIYINMCNDLKDNIIKQIDAKRPPPTSRKSNSFYNDFVIKPKKELIEFIDDFKKNKTFVMNLKIINNEKFKKNKIFVLRQNLFTTFFLMILNNDYKVLKRELSYILDEVRLNYRYFDLKRKKTLGIHDICTVLYDVSVKSIEDYYPLRLLKTNITKRDEFINKYMRFLGMKKENFINQNFKDKLQKHVNTLIVNESLRKKVNRNKIKTLEIVSRILEYYHDNNTSEESKNKIEFIIRRIYHNEVDSGLNYINRQQFYNTARRERIRKVYNYYRRRNIRNHKDDGTHEFNNLTLYLNNNN